MVKCDLNIGKEEIQALAELALNGESCRKVRRRTCLCYGIFAVLLLVLGTDKIFQEVRPINVVLLVFCALCIYLATIGMKQIQRRGIYRALKKAGEEMTSGNRHYEIAENGITIESSAGKGFHQWSEFNGYGEYSHYFWIMGKDGNAVLLDKNHLKSDEISEVQNCLTYIEK